MERARLCRTGLCVPSRRRPSRRKHAQDYLRGQQIQTLGEWWPRFVGPAPGIKRGNAAPTMINKTPSLSQNCAN
jgi:hypothetical protein